MTDNPSNPPSAPLGAPNERLEMKLLPPLPPMLKKIAGLPPAPRIALQQKKFDYFPPEMPPLKGMNGNNYIAPKRGGDIFASPPKLSNKPLTYIATVKGEEVEKRIIITDSVMRILQMLSIFRRLTLEQIAYAFAIQDNKNVFMAAESLRRGAVLKLLAGGLIKKISPPNDRVFFILTALGSAYCDLKNVLELNLLDDSMPLDESFHAEAHYLIMNRSSVGIKLLFGNNENLLGDESNSDDIAVFEAPVPIITENEILTSTLSSGNGTSEAVKLQESAIESWIRENRTGTRAYQNLMFDAHRAKTMRDSWLKTLSVNGQNIQPAFLNASFNAKNRYEPIIDFVILHENLNVRTKIHVPRLNGSSAVIVESIMQSVQYYEYKLFEIFASRLGYTSLYCYTPYATINSEISTAWVNLIRKNLIPKEFVSWLQIRSYLPLNSSSEESNLFARPVQTREVRNWSQG